MNLVKTFATTLTVLACIAPTTLAQASSEAADEKEIAAYRLTTESLTKLKKVVRLAAEAEAKSPKVQVQIKLQAAVDSLRKKDELSDAEQARLEKLEQQLAKAEEEDDLLADESLSQMAKKISEYKPIADALRQAGMTPREFAVWTMAYAEAAMAVSLKQAGMTKDIPKDVNLANVKFVEDHMAEITAMQQEYERITKKRP